MVENELGYKVYPGRGDTGPYAIDFEVQLDDSGNAKDVHVFHDDNLGGAPTEITGTCTFTGLNVYTVDAHPPTDTLTLIRSPSLKQLSEYLDGDAFPAKRTEKDFDRIYFILQYFKHQIDNFLKAPISEGAQLWLPSIANRRGKFFFFEDTDQALPGTALGVPSVPATAWAATLLDDPNVAAALATLGLSTRKITTASRLIGAPFYLGSVGSVALAKLESTDVAFIDSSTELLSRYHWNESVWAAVGSALSIPGIGEPALARLSATDVVFIDDTIEELRRYHWNGTTFELVGSGLSIPGITTPALAALDSTDVVLMDQGLASLRRYHWNGTTFELVGSGLSIAGIGRPALAGLTSSDVAFIDATLESLRRYHWNGTTFELVGSSLSIAGIGNASLAAFGENDVVLAAATLDFIRRYHWNGSQFFPVDNGLTLTSMGASAMATLGEWTVAFADGSYDYLRTFEIGGEVTVCVPST